MTTELQELQRSQTMKDFTEEELQAIGNTDTGTIWAVIVDHPLGNGIAAVMSERFGLMPMITTHKGKLLEFYRQEVVRLEKETGLKHSVRRYIRQDFDQ